MDNKNQLIEGAIYRIKVGLFAEKWGETTLGQHGMFKPGSHVFYDQENAGWHVFGGFAPYTDYYCRIPDDIVHDEVELVDKENLVPLK